MSIKAKIVNVCVLPLVAYAKVFGRTKELNDGTNGLRFQMLGVVGLWRQRSIQKRYGVTQGDTTVGYHYGYRSVYFEKKGALRMFWNFAG